MMVRSVLATALAMALTACGGGGGGGSNVRVDPPPTTPTPPTTPPPTTPPPAKPQEPAFDAHLSVTNARAAQAAGHLHPAATAQPVFMAHGSGDPVIPLVHAEHGARVQLLDLCGIVARDTTGGSQLQQLLTACARRCKAGLASFKVFQGVALVQLRQHEGFACVESVNEGQRSLKSRLGGGGQSRSRLTLCHGHR